MKISINPRIPISQSLLETIQGFFQFTHMELIPMSHKAFWLFNVDFLINFSIEEGSFYIHLMEFPSKHNSKGDDSFDGGISGDRSKSFIIVYAFFFSEGTSYKSSLILFNVVISSMLDFVKAIWMLPQIFLSV